VSSEINSVIFHIYCHISSQNLLLVFICELWEAITFRDGSHDCGRRGFSTHHDCSSGLLMGTAGTAGLLKDELLVCCRRDGNTWNWLAARQTVGNHRKTTFHTQGTGQKRRHVGSAWHTVDSDEPTSPDMIVWHLRPEELFSQWVRTVCPLQSVRFLPRCP